MIGISNIKYQISNIQKTHQTGFTLIELLIYIAIFAMVLAIAVDLFFRSQILETQVAQHQEVDRNARVVLLEMTQTIRGATEVSSPVLGASGATLSLNSNAIDYAVGANGILQKTDSGGTYDITTDGVVVEGLTFTTRGESGAGKPPTVSISFTLRANTLVYGQATHISKAYQTTVQLR